MTQSIGYVALVVRDYDEAIGFYVNRLGFAMVEDKVIEAQGKQWMLLLEVTCRCESESTFSS